MRLSAMGLASSTIQVLAGREVARRNRRLPSLAYYFGSRAEIAEDDLLEDLILDSVVIAPLVSSLNDVAAEIPERISNTNALELGLDGQGVERAISLAFEVFRLLRRERRLFISYKRTDSQPLAERLYDALDARGFDVFIDLRSVPPAVDFQSELWHRMSDSDVVVLIDTPGFRQSRWTTEELAQANATNIQILHLLWPGQDEDKSSAFSHFSKIRLRDFWFFLPLRGRTTKASKIARICDEAERLRARAIAARYRYLIDNFCDAARDLRLEVTVQPGHWISVVNGRNGKSLAVIPAIGIPTSDRINEIFEEASARAGFSGDIWIVYDNRGVLSRWLSHLDWLDNHLPLRTVKMARAAERLKGWSV